MCWATCRWNVFHGKNSMICENRVFPVYMHLLCDKSLKRVHFAATAFKSETPDFLCNCCNESDDLNFMTLQPDSSGLIHILYCKPNYSRPSLGHPAKFKIVLIATGFMFLCLVKKCSAPCLEIHLAGGLVTILPPTQKPRSFCT